MQAFKDSTTQIIIPRQPISHVATIIEHIDIIISNLVKYNIRMQTLEVAVLNALTRLYIKAYIILPL